MRLANKTAIITGASQGIGLACATRLVQEGARVMLVDIRPEGRDAAARLGEAARFHQADVSLKADVDAMIAVTLEAFGQVDILVNNAGVTHAADFLELAEEDFDRVLRINLKSMFLCSQAAAREMVKRQTGCIINMSSVNAELTIPNQVPYVVSKGGVNQLTRVAAISLAEHGIRVNAIGPGTILTELAKKAVLGSPEAAPHDPVAHAARTLRRARGSCRRLRLPGQRRRVLHHGPDPVCRRWPHGAELHGTRARVSAPGQHLDETDIRNINVWYPYSKLDVYLATQHNLICLHYSPPRK